MTMPAARVGDTSMTGDAVTGPGAPTVLIGNMPASVVGDGVSGAACVGAVVMGSATVLIMGRPASKMGSSVAGANPASGAPVSTTLGIPCCPTVLIGG